MFYSKYSDRQVWAGFYCFTLSIQTDRPELGFTVSFTLSIQKSRLGTIQD